MSKATIEMIVPIPQADEFGVGLMVRIARLNGYSPSGLRAALKNPGAHNAARLPLIEGLAAAFKQSASNFARLHTILPFRHAFSKKALPFCDPYWTSGHMWRRATALLPRSAIRFCRSCAAEEVAERGFSFWRRSHQLPAMAICPKHGERLSALATELALGSLPHEIRDASCTPILEFEKGSEIVARYGEIATALLERDAPYPTSAVQTVVRTRVDELGLRIDRQGKRASIGDVALDRAPASWMQEHFLASGTLRSNTYSVKSLRNVCVCSEQIASSAYALALTVLFASSRDALAALNAAQVCEASPRVRKISSRRDWASPDTLAAYVECRGVMQHAADRLGVNSMTMTLGLKRLGVIALGHLLDTGMDRALMDVFDGVPINDACERHGVSVFDVQAILRRTSPLFAEVLGRALKQDRGSSRAAAMEEKAA